MTWEKWYPTECPCGRGTTGCGQKNFKCLQTNANRSIKEDNK